ncbi:hypothetical protein HOF78_00560 [Candidatus Woesearchaeota archaeon]|jgi:hypothetical protein|nr:hypothetical protein [Candidatus Woesearchaeota archaeon]MBT6044542.1 hypothetical protein [Candidatus Woesearchaeota archaeon]
MAGLDETTKNILLFLGLVVLIGAIVFITLSFFDDSDPSLDVEENINESIENLEELPDQGLELTEVVVSSQFSDSVKPDHIQKGSMKIRLGNVYAEESNGGEWDLYIEVLGEDLLVDEGESRAAGNFFFRSPLSWNADLMKHRKDLNPLLTCDLNSEGRFWNTTYCISLNALDEGYFGQTVRLVYTDKSIADVEELTLLALTREDRTFIFELQIPKEFYEQLV